MSNASTVRLFAALLWLNCATAAEPSALTLWTTDPWIHFSPDARSVAPGSAATVQLQAARSEYESGVLMVTNEGERTIHARVGLEAIEGSRDLPPEHVILREAVHIRTRNGRYVPDALPQLTPARIVTLPAGETRQLWLEVRTHGLRAGDYECRIRLLPVDGAPAATALLRLHVWDFVLPQRMPIAVFNWDYKIRGLSGSLRSKTLAEMIAHGINVFQISGSPKVVCDGQGNLVQQPDFSAWDDLIELEKPHGTFLFETWQFRGRPFMSTSGKTIEYLSQEWIRAFEAWLKAFVAYTKQRGLTYQAWAFYPFDEYIGPKFVGLAKEIRRIDPKILIFTDRVDKPELVRAAAPYADIWCPYDGHCGASEFKESFEIIRSTGKPTWFYFCGRSQKGWSPTSRYRLMGWKAWHRKLQGCTYWNIFGRVDSEWDDFDGRYPDPGTVYWGRNGLITSRRWEAFREGLEDYCYLYLLDAALKGRNDAKALALLRSAPPDVLGNPEDAAKLHRWRRQIAERIMILGGRGR